MTAPVRERAINLHAAIVLLLALFVVVHGLRLASGEANVFFVLYASFVPLRYTEGVIDPLWAYLASPVTYAFMHGSWTHLLLNGLWMVVFGSPLAARWGTARFLAFFALTAALSAALHFALNPQSIAPLVGASGAVSAMTAAAARFGFRTDASAGLAAFRGSPLGVAETLRHRTSLTFILVWFAINLVMIVVPGFALEGAGRVSWEAHLGGFLAGFALVGPFDRGHRAP